MMKHCVYARLPLHCVCVLRGGRGGAWVRGCVGVRARACVYSHPHTQPLRLAHLPPAPSPPSACLCRSCRPFPAPRSRGSPSSRRRRPPAARTCGRHPRRGRRRLQRDAEGGDASVCMSLGFRPAKWAKCCGVLLL